MEAEDVIQVLDALDEAGVRHWVGGGWGVAALAGRQTRGVFVTGFIVGRVVGCLSARQQRHFHTGYEHRPQDASSF